MPNPKCACFVFLQTYFISTVLLVSAGLAGSPDPLFQQKLDKVGLLPGQNFNISFSHYSGYVNVNKESGRALFYWFIEAAKDPSSKPLVLWLNGGPGCSSIAYGEAEEIGPFHIREDGMTLYLNHYSWNHVANILFLDSPIGVGYSYSNTSSDLLNNGDKRTAGDSLEFLLNWFERFPQYKGRDFYITGESYAGHYVPQLSQGIVRYNLETQKASINLKGYMVGNALTDDFHDHLGVFQFLWSAGLISDQTYKLVNLLCDFQSFIHPSSSCDKLLDIASEEMGNIDPYSIFTPPCTANDTLSNQLLKRMHAVGRINEKYDPCTEKHSTVYFNLPEVQQALHVNPIGATSTGENISFWEDRWLEQPASDGAGIIDRPQLRVSDIIRDGNWDIPDTMRQSYPHLYEQIMQIPLPTETDAPDILTWPTVTSGSLSLSDAYSFLSDHTPSHDDFGSLWSPSVPPRLSVVTWRLLHGKLPTHDALQRVGVSLVSICPLCRCAQETQDHLFWQCPFSQALWKWVEETFSIPILKWPSFKAFWNQKLPIYLSPQNKRIIIFTIICTCYSIWIARNDAIFRAKRPSLYEAKQYIFLWRTSLSGPSFKGACYLGEDAQHIQKLGVRPNLPKAPKVLLVFWLPPMKSWIKLNTDGLAKGSPGQAAIGGVFRNCRGFIKGAYCQAIGVSNAFQAELLAVITGIQKAWHYGWHRLWLEMDSELVLRVLQKTDYVPPPVLRNSFQQCRSYMRRMEIKATHIYREGNRVADRLSQEGLDHHLLKWWDSPPPFLWPLLFSDILPSPQYRFVKSK